jgi:hypothetical protein
LGARRAACQGGWWVQSAADASVFSLNIDEAVFISWEIGQREMTISDGRHSWDTRKLRVTTRKSARRWVDLANR